MDSTVRKKSNHSKSCNDSCRNRNIECVCRRHWCGSQKSKKEICGSKRRREKMLVGGQGHGKRIRPSKKINRSKICKDRCRCCKKEQVCCRHWSCRRLVARIAKRKAKGGKKIRDSCRNRKINRVNLDDVPINN